MLWHQDFTERPEYFAVTVTISFGDCIKYAMERWFISSYLFFIRQMKSPAITATLEEKNKTGKTV